MITWDCGWTKLHNCALKEENDMAILALVVTIYPFQNIFLVVKVGRVRAEASPMAI